MTALGNLKLGYQEVWKAIIRPPRDAYTIRDLGPPKFFLKDKAYKRTDIKLQNRNGATLECSHFEPVNPPSKTIPCVLYLHGNSSSRVEAITAAEVLLPLNVSVFCFDFTGCGHSGGEYISLGWYEWNDVDTVIEYLRSTRRVSKLGLWGRSMGAVTALLYAEKDPSIAGLVLDSPFTNLRLLIDEIAKKHTRIPKFIVSGAMSLVRKTILTKAKFDINKVNPIDHIGTTLIPALFVAGTNDDFVEPHHARDLYEKYRGKKNLMMVEGDHNTTRPNHLLESVAAFFQTMLSMSSTLESEKMLFKDLSEKTIKKIKEERSDDNVVKFELKEKNLTIIGANEDHIYLQLGAGLHENEFLKAIEQSIKLAHENITEPYGSGGVSKSETHLSFTEEIIDNRALMTENFSYEKRLLTKG